MGEAAKSDIAERYGSYCGTAFFTISVSLFSDIG
jgi:hypothetical protein